MTGDLGPRYTVRWNQVGIGRLRALAEAARTRGVLPEWVDTLRQIRDRLESDPRGSGDPLYRLNGLSLLMHRALIDRVEVVYGVHDSAPMVFIQAIRPRLGHPLEGE
jgi:hypothetical protein